MRSLFFCRSRWRPLAAGLFLFGLGVSTCLMFVQMRQNAIDGVGVVMYSDQEYQQSTGNQNLPYAQQLQQQQQEPPCEGGGNKGVGSGHSSSMKTSNTHPNPKTSLTPSLPRLHQNQKRSSHSDPEQEENDISFSTSPSPTVWVVTPTFYRPEQKPELTRLAQALLPVKDFVHWIIVEDVTQGSNYTFKDLEAFMLRFPEIKYTLLKSFPPSVATKIVGKPRGVGGRRAAIDWLRKRFTNNREEANGVVYFADDDNTYDSSVFREMQGIKKCGMWPVGLVTDLGVSSPIVQRGKVIGFYDGWRGRRKYAVDMAGFAINLQLFLDKPNANMPWVVGYEEDELLKSLGIEIQDIEPLANNCTEILVWHTKAQRPPWPKEPKSLKPGLLSSTNLQHLLQLLPKKSLAKNPVDQRGFSLMNIIFGV